ncbi:MAG: hypothetical protein PHP19_08425, partial [Firmicutes bacterium]|nr:hypothetical protein [Bacillota bacterium]
SEILRTFFNMNTKITDDNPPRIKAFKTINFSSYYLIVTYNNKNTQPRSFAIAQDDNHFAQDDKNASFAIFYTCVIIF